MITPGLRGTVVMMWPTKGKNNLCCKRARMVYRLMSIDEGWQRFRKYDVDYELQRTAASDMRAHHCIRNWLISHCGNNQRCSISVRRSFIER